MLGVIKRFEDYISMRIKEVELTSMVLGARYLSKDIDEDAYNKDSSNVRQCLYILNSIMETIEISANLELFDNFDVLCDLIFDFEATEEEALEIIMRLVKNNIIISNKEKDADISQVLNFQKILDFDFKTRTKNEVRTLIESRKILKFFIDTGEEITDAEEDFFDELEANQESFFSDLSKVKEINETALKHYENMKGLNDVERIISSLKLLEVNDKMINYIRPFIEKKARRIEKRQAKEEAKAKELNTPKVSVTKKQVEAKKYLTEKEVRDLKKFVRQFFDLYRVNLISVPCLTDLITCLENLETLESDSNEIKRFLSMNLDEILNLENYINTYEELIKLVHYLIKYKIEEIKIDELINKYKYLKEHNSNPVTEATNYMAEYSYYDNASADELKYYLSEIEESTDEEYINYVKGLILEYLELLKQFENNTEYEKYLARNYKK